MERVRAAALSPSDPSPQDRAVAAEASAIEADARTQESTEKQTGSSAPVNVYAHKKATKAYVQQGATTGFALGKTYA
jgi:hypothetical protein